MSATASGWTLFRWLPTNDMDADVHPESLAALSAAWSLARIYRVAGRDDGYVTLAAGPLVVRVRPSHLLRPVRAPRFDYGAAVTTTITSRHAGTVVEIAWHDKRAEPMFFIEVDGKRRSRRYFEDELAPI